MRERKPWQRMLAGALALSLLLFPQTVKADELEEVQQQQDVTQNELDEMQTQKAEKKEAVDAKSNHLETLSGEQAELNTQLQALDESILAKREELEKLKAQIAELEESIKQTQKEIDTLEVRIRKNTKKFKERLNVMYKNGGVGSVEILLSSSGINDFLSRARTMKTLADYDRNLIEELAKDMKDREKKKNELTGKKTALDIAKENEQSKLEEMQKEQGRKMQVLEQLNVQIDLTKEEMDALQAASDALQDRIDVKMSELNALASKEDEIKKERAERAQREAEEAAGRAAAGVAASEAQGVSDADYGASPSNGKASAEGFLWPTTSYTITSPFGYRIHPIYGVGRFHSGIDIGAGHGEPVYATASGTIVDAGYFGGYGYLVEIQHDNGWVSRYAHLSAFNCSVGQRVNQGDVVAFVGSTGDSTGPHLHFELLHDGNLVNPLGYL